MPPPYSVATSLPTYDEAEKAKAAAMATSSVETIPRVRLELRDACPAPAPPRGLGRTGLTASVLRLIPGRRIPTQR